MSKVSVLQVLRNALVAKIVAANETYSKYNLECIPQDLNPDLRKIVDLFQSRTFSSNTFVNFDTALVLLIKGLGGPDLSKAIECSPKAAMCDHCLVRLVEPSTDFPIGTNLFVTNAVNRYAVSFMIANSTMRFGQDKKAFVVLEPDQVKALVEKAPPNSLMELIRTHVPSLFEEFLTKEFDIVDTTVKEPVSEVLSATAVDSAPAVAQEPPAPPAAVPTVAS
jgi:hypothetical protein